METARVLTVDVEDWFHCLEPEPGKWSEFERRVEVGTIHLLDILRRKGSSATFFVLGDVARNQPDIVSMIAAEGHEIGTHGMYHRFVYEQTPEQFRRDLLESMDLIESITGKRVTAFRAPFFSITRDSLWALDIIAEAGIRVDSSVFPVRNPRYGIPDAKRVPHQIIPGLWEWPISTIPSAIGNIPVGGGVYVRLMPRLLLMLTMNKLLRGAEPMVLYFHPWELDPGQPRMDSIGPFLKFRHYYGLKSTAKKLSSLLDLARFESFETAMQAIALRQTT